MPTFERNSAPRGPRFYDDEGTLMFINILDTVTRDGPRKATAQDKRDYPDAHEAFKTRAPDVFPGSTPLVTFTDPIEKAPI